MSVVSVVSVGVGGLGGVGGLKGWRWLIRVRGDIVESSGALFLESDALFS